MTERKPTLRNLPTNIERLAAVLWLYDAMPQEMGRGDALRHWNDRVFPASGEVIAMYRERAALMAREYDAHDA